MTNGGKNSSWSKLIIVIQICAVVTKNVSGTTMIFLTAVVLCNDVVVTIRGIEACFENKRSISWDEMSMF